MEIKEALSFSYRDSIWPFLLSSICNLFTIVSIYVIYLLQMTWVSTCFSFLFARSAWKWKRNSG